MMNANDVWEAMDKNKKLFIVGTNYGNEAADVKYYARPVHVIGYSLSADSKISFIINPPGIGRNLFEWEFYENEEEAKRNAEKMNRHLTQST